MKKSVFVLFYVVGLLLLSSFSTAWSAEKYPSQSVELISAAPAGSYADLINRSLAKTLEKYLNVLVIPGNKPGGGDMVAAAAVANTAPNGYTLGFLADGPLIYSHLLGRKKTSA